jgi:VanZ family protein
MRRVIFFFLSGFWTAFIFYNSLQPGSESAEISGRFVRLFGVIFDRLGIAYDHGSLSIIVRKAAHIFEFFVLALLLFQLFKDNKYRYLGVAVCGFTVAVIDETIQHFVPGRVGAIVDVAIDMGGVALALLLYLLIRTLFAKRTVN